MNKSVKTIALLCLLALTIVLPCVLGRVALAEHEHDFSSGRCECGAAKIEAESGTVDGTPQTGSVTFMENELPTASGGLCVGYWGEHSDNTLSVAFNLDKDVANAKIELTLAIAMVTLDGDVPRNSQPTDSFDGASWFGFKVNGKYYGFESGEIPDNDGSYENWGTVVSFALPLKVGANTIVLEANPDNRFNFDYFVLDIPSDVTAEYIEADTTKPQIGVISVSPYKPFCGETVQVGYVATDNETAEDKLTVNVAMYYNYKKSGSRALQADDQGNYMPTKPGTYTIVVTVTDESGNTARRMRVFTVTQDLWHEPMPTPPAEPMDGGVVVGIVALCVAFGGAAIITAITLALRKRNASKTLSA